MGHVDALVLGGAITALMITIVVCRAPSNIHRAVPRGFAHLPWVLF